MTEPSSVPRHAAADELPRRSVLVRAVALLAGAIAGLVPLAVGAIFFVDPLTRRKRAVGATGNAVDANGFIRVTTTDALAEDGSPRSFKIIADLQDFWNKFPDSEIGSVYLRRDESGVISCFNARCPHLGCTFNYDAGQKKYICPCHASSFDLAGRRSNDIPPRDLDTLDYEVRNDNEIWVRFQKFQTGTEEKKAV